MLSRIGEPAIPRLIQSLGSEDEQAREGAIQVLSRIGEPAIPALIQSLGSESWRTRIAAQETLSNIGQRQGSTALSLVKSLKTALESESEGIRAGAARVLGNLKKRSVMSALVRKLQEDPSPEVRIASAQALGEIGGDGILVHLIRALGDQEEKVRSAVVAVLQEALPKLGDSALGVLIGALQNRNKDIRLGAIRVLREVGTKKAIPYLQEIVDDSDEIEEVRKEARRSLEGIRQRLEAQQQSVKQIQQVIEQKQRSKG